MRFFELKRGKWDRISEEHLEDACYRLDNINEEIHLSVYWYSIESQYALEKEGPLIFDLDGQGSHHETRKLVNHLLELGIGEEHLRLSFSGRRGFHVVVDHQVIGLRPNQDLQEIHKLIAQHFRNKLDLSTIDMNSYAERKLFRAVGSRRKDGWDGIERSIPLTVSQVRQSPKTYKNLQPERVLPLYRVFPESDVKPLPIFEEIVGSYRKRPKPVYKPSAFADQAALPPCVRDVLERGLRETGTRNKAVVAMAGFLKAAGMDVDDARELMIKWSLEQTLTYSNDKELTREAKDTVNWAYGKEGAFASCTAIKKIGTHDNPITCTLPVCKFAIDDERCLESQYYKDLLSHVDITEEAPKTNGVHKEIDTVPLSDIILPKYEKDGCESVGDIISIGRKITTSPGDAVITCKDPGLDMCKTCQVTGGKKRISMARATIISEAIQDHQGLVSKLVQKLSKVPDDCPGHKVEHKPPNIFIPVTITPPYDQEMEKDEKVMSIDREVFLMNHHSPQAGDRVRIRTKQVQTKQHVRMVATRVTQKPKFISGYIPDLLPPERIKGSGHDVIEQLLQFHETAEQYTGIIGRPLQSLGTFLTWLTPMAMPVCISGKRPRRNFLNVFSIGDPGQGKSELAFRFLELTGLGKRITGENMSAAGLLIGASNSSSGWFPRIGILPRMDQELVVVDELHGAVDEVIAALTDALDTGICTMSKITDMVALARTRKIMIANPTSGRGKTLRMASRAFGIEHVPYTFKSTEDIRRLDYVMGFKLSSDVDKEIAGMYGKTYATQRREIYAELAKWAWSLEQGRVQIEGEVEEACRNWGEEISSRYSRKIPLLVKGDTNHKLLRVGSAIAVHCASMDDAGTLIIRPEHVEAAHHLLRALYDLPDLNYNKYTERKDVSFTPDDDFLNKLQTKLVSSDDLAIKFTYEAYDCMLMNTLEVSPRDIAEYVDETPEEVMKLIRELCKVKMAERSGRGYRLTEAGVEGVNKLYEDHLDSKAAGRLPKYGPGFL